MRFLFFHVLIVVGLLSALATSGHAATLTLDMFITKWEKVERPQHDLIQQWQKDLGDAARIDIVLFGDDLVFYTVSHSCPGRDRVRVATFRSNQRVISATDCYGRSVREKSIVPWLSITDKLPVPVEIALAKSKSGK